MSISYLFIHFFSTVGTSEHFNFVVLMRLNKFNHYNYDNEVIFSTRLLQERTTRRMIVAVAWCVVRALLSADKLSAVLVSHVWTNGHASN